MRKTVSVRLDGTSAEALGEHNEVNSSRGAPMLHIDLSKEIAVVTGGSGELRRVIVRMLARCGADVVIHYFRNDERARVLLEELPSLGVRAMTVQADVTQPASSG